MSRVPSLTRGAAIASIAIAAALAAAPAAFAVPPGVAISDPDSGVKLATKMATLPATAAELDLSNSAGWVEAGYLNYDENCALAEGTYVPDSAPAESGPSSTSEGDELPAPDEAPSSEPAPADASVAPAVGFNGDEYRVYSTITIVKAGLYTFRVVDSTVELGADHPFDDPYLALYSSFSLANLDSGVVGCNDDGGLTGDYFPGYESSPYNELWPQFTATLQPGTYTLLLTTYNNVTAERWATEQLGPQSVTFEYWGPECGVEGGSCELASTGVDTSAFLAAAFAMLVVGLGALAVSRRRRGVTAA